MFIVKVIAVLNPGFPEAWRMVEAGQIAGFAYIWLLVFLVLLCCFVLWRIVPKGYFRKKKPETSRPAGEWAVSIPTHENPVVVGNPFRGIFIAGAAGSGKSESVDINPFMFPICPGVILSELSSSFRSNSLGVFDKQFRDCFRCVFSIVIRISLVPYTKPINIKKAEGHLPIRRTGSRSPTRTNRKHRSRICGRASILFS